MPSSSRDRVRERFAARCGYCGVSDVAIGSTLTIDHHRPRSWGGGDEDENLIYACSRCNEHKGAYWHEHHPPHVPLLHPGHHDLALHVREGADGCLVGLTPEGMFLIERLRLNRAPLVSHRLGLRAAAVQREALDAARVKVHELEQRISRMRADFDSTVDEIQQQTSTDEGGDEP